MKETKVKSDKSKHNICIASIKRSTMKPYDFKWTKFYDFDTYFPYSGLKLDLTQNELIICSTYIDGDNYSVLTTQRLITKENGQITSGNIDGAVNKTYGDFKGYKDKLFTFGQIELRDGACLKYFVETGKASMVMIHGVRTLIRIKEMTDTQVDKVTKIWVRKSEA
jgi:hypothetical protein